MKALLLIVLALALAVGCRQKDQAAEVRTAASPATEAAVTQTAGVAGSDPAPLDMETAVEELFADFEFGFRAGLRAQQPGADPEPWLRKLGPPVRAEIQAFLNGLSDEDRRIFLTTDVQDIARTAEGERAAELAVEFGQRLMKVSVATISPR